MTTVSIWRDNTTGKIKAFEFYGHAKYAKFGKDIVCSAVSVLSLTTINSIEKFCSDEFDVTHNDKEALIRCVFKNECSDDAMLLLNSMILGLEQIQNEYGNKYIKINFEEV